MPQMSGLQAIRLLRTLGRRDFVVGLTGQTILIFVPNRRTDMSWLGNALLPDQREYIDAGVDQYVNFLRVCSLLMPSQSSNQASQQKGFGGYSEAGRFETTTDFTLATT